MLLYGSFGNRAQFFFARILLVGSSTSDATPAALFFTRILLVGSSTLDVMLAALGLRAAFIRRTTSSPLPALLATFFDADCTDYADVRAHIAIAQADEAYTKAIILVIHRRRRRRLILIYDVDDHEELE